MIAPRCVVAKAAGGTISPPYGAAAKAATPRSSASIVRRSIALASILNGAAAAWKMGGSNGTGLMSDYAIGTQRGTHMVKKPARGWSKSAGTRHTRKLRAEARATVAVNPDAVLK